jgi:parallel beta-helix repeat protein
MSAKNKALLLVSRMALGRYSLAAVCFLAFGAADVLAYPAVEFALKRTGTPIFYLDYNGDSVPDRTVGYGAATDIGLVGDFDGDTISDLALYRDGVWYIDYYNDSIADRFVVFGGSQATDSPVVADFNADGKADIGVYRNDGVWYIDFNLDGIPDRVSVFGGAAGDIPVVADFNNDGSTDRAIYRLGRWYVDFDWNGASAEAQYIFGGAAQDIPFAADFNNDGFADVGIFRDGIWYIDVDRNGAPDQIRFFGAAGDRPLVGYFNIASSIFVRAGAAGSPDGSQKMPYSTIGSALAANPPPNTIIRIAAGTYPERVSISQKPNLTFQGAGPTATHINPAAGDVFSAFRCQGNTLRDIHFKSQGPDGTTPGRGIINLGSSMTLEHVSTAGGWDIGLIAAQFQGSPATLNVDRSSFDSSRIGNGIQLDTGTSATVNRSSASDNGTEPANMPPPPAAPGGRGVVLFNTAAITLTNSHVSRNYDGGILMTHSSNAVLRNNFVEQNGTAGAYYELQATGEITGNLFANNGARGTRGPGGNNGVEIAGIAAPMTISGNTFSTNTLNGIFVEDGTVNILNNTFFYNYVGVTVANSRNRPVNIVIRGNLFDLPASPLYSEGVFMQSSTTATMTIVIGGSASAEKNTFRNFGSFPAVHCFQSTINAMCAASGNIFINSTFPVQNCPSCSP